MNSEIFGHATTLPWGFRFLRSREWQQVCAPAACHPTQLYEALLEGLVLFAVLYLLSRKVPPRPRGTFLGTFLTLYGAFRVLVEFVRQPDAQLGYLWGGWLTMGQVLSVPLVVAGVVVLTYALRRRLPERGLLE